MAFNLGGQPPAPPPAGGSSFFNTPAAPPATPGGGFAAGGTPAPATTLPAFGGVSFGASAAAPPAAGGFTAGGTPAPTLPAFGGATFGASGIGPTPNAFGTATTNPAATNTGANLFGAGAGAAAGAATATGTAPPAFGASVGGGFGAPPAFGGSAAFGGGLATPALAGGTPLVVVPNFQDVFSGHLLWETLQPLIDKALQNDVLAGQELVHILSSDSSSLGKLLLQPHLVWKEARLPDNSLRQQLAQQREVILRGGEKATLTENMLREVIQIAEELQLPERDALSLYAHARSQQSHTVDFATRAREIYFAERAQHLKTLLYLFQHRGNASDGSDYLRASDTLLLNGMMGNLLKLIQDYTSRIQQWTSKIMDYDKSTASATGASFPGMNASHSQSDRQRQIAASHCNFGIHERQCAAECLFFISYYTQIEVSEITSLVDSIQFLTNPSTHLPGLLRLDPLKDVPSVYTNDASAAPSFPFTAALPPLQEKDTFAWQQELVLKCHISGQAALLRCVSILVLTGITALDTRQTLVDRMTHATNPWGRGNALLPPDHTGSLSHLDPIQAKLNPAVASQWQRPDVLGILLAAYGLLLRTAPSALSSPRAGSGAARGGGGSWSPSDIRHRGLEYLEKPAELKSFTFGRLSLVPALSIPHAGNTEEFFWSVLSGWAAQYLEYLVVSPPISRAKWLQDQKDDLRLRQQDRNQQSEFQRWSQTTSGPLQDLPDYVDILDRSDCMDDVVEFCVAVGSKNTALAFWDTSDTSNDLSPKRALLKIEKMQIDDDSLRPSYLDLLTMLAKSDLDDFGNASAAAKVHSFLAAPPDAQDVPIETRWTAILEMIRYYARELSGNGVAMSSRQPSSSSSRGQSTAYYYLDRDQTEEFSQRSKTSSSSSTQKNRELGETNTRILTAHLKLLVAVASRSDEARTYLRGMSLPVESGADVVGQDTTIRVLFTLAWTHLSPEVRGMVLSAIAAILPGCKYEEALSAWEEVESSGFLPIYKLQQYPDPIGENDAPRIAFPPSSTNRKKIASWIPPEQSFSILYEMEYVEAVCGCYPSTIGFLKLLTALVVSGGCPSDLGRNWRSRTGCTPYVEYAMSLVLPRAMGTFEGLPALPFRSTGEKSALLTSALKVVDACSSRYLIPEPITKGDKDALQKRFASAQKQARDVLGLEALVTEAVVMPLVDDFITFTNDFRQETSLPAAARTHETAPSGQSQNVLMTSVPAPKSPGFTTLIATLRRDRESFFATLSAIISALDPASFESNDDQLSMSLALFGNLRPTFESSKSGKSKSRSNLALSLGDKDETTYSQAKSNVEEALALSLRLICIAATKESQLASALHAADVWRMVPTLRFNVRPSAPVVWDLRVARTLDMLETFGVTSKLPAFIRYSGEDVRLPSFGCALYFHANDSAQILSNRDAFYQAFAKLISDLRDELRFRSMKSRAYADLFTFLLERILIDFKKQGEGRCSIVGAPTVDALMKAALSMDFATSQDSAAVAALCFQILHLSGEQADLRQSVLVHFMGFWHSSLNLLMPWVRSLETGHCPKELYLSVEWVLKGIGGCLKQTVAASLASHLPTGGFGSTDAGRFLALLFDRNVLAELFQLLPVDCEDPKYAIALSDGLHVCLGSLLIAASQASVRLEMVTIITVILHQLKQGFDAVTLRNLSRALYLSVEHTHLPTGQTAELLSAVGDAVASVPTSKGYLVATLAIILRRLNPSNGEFESTLLQVAETLMQMCCEGSQMARESLKMLWSGSSASAVHRVFGTNSTPLEALIRLTAQPDGDICGVLSMVAKSSLGSDHLVRSGILAALHQGACTYQQQVDGIRQNSIHALSIGLPEFLHDHLQLMSTILLTVSDNLLFDAATQAGTILKRYDPTFKQLAASFPTDGDTVMEYYTCLSAVQRALFRASSTMDVLSSAQAMPDYGPVAALTYRLAENPLPRQLLGPLPSILTQTSSSTPSHIVHVILPDTSWWDSLNDRDVSDVCFFGKQAAEIVVNGLCIIRTSTLAKVDILSIARALCACVDSILWVDRSLRTGSGSSTDFDLFRDQLICMLLELLRVAIMHVQGGAQQISNSLQLPLHPNKVREVLGAALDRTKLESREYSSQTGASGIDQDTVANVAKKLRNLIRY